MKIINILCSLGGVVLRSRVFWFYVPRPCTFTSSVVLATVDASRFLFASGLVVSEVLASVALYDYSFGSLCLHSDFHLTYVC